MSLCLLRNSFILHPLSGYGVFVLGLVPRGTSPVTCWIFQHGCPVVTEAELLLPIQLLPSTARFFYPLNSKLLPFLSLHKNLTCLKKKNPATIFPFSLLPCPIPISPLSWIFFFSGATLIGSPVHLFLRT